MRPILPSLGQCAYSRVTVLGLHLPAPFPVPTHATQVSVQGHLWGCHLSVHISTEAVGTKKLQKTFCCFFLESTTRAGKGCQPQSTRACRCTRLSASRLRFHSSSWIKALPASQQQPLWQRQRVN